MSWMGDRFFARLLKALRFENKTAGKQLLSRITQSAPDDTGAYKKGFSVNSNERKIGINFDPQRNSKTNNIEPPNLPEYLEYGTRNKRSQPHIVKAVKNSKDIWEKWSNRVKRNLGD